MPTNDEINALLRRLIKKQNQQQANYDHICRQYAELENQLREQPKSPSQEIDAIPGRRIKYELTGSMTFDESNAGRRGTGIRLEVSQDGPYLWVGYPVVMWRPSAPSDAVNLGRWRPVYSWPLPLQSNFDGSESRNTDIIDISYEFQDSGSQRNLQNQPAPPLFSRPDALLPLPMITLLAPGTILEFTPTFHAIDFNPGGDGGVGRTTQGTLVVSLPGFRVVNL